MIGVTAHSSSNNFSINFGTTLFGFLPGIEPITRWSVLMYTTLPASYLAPNLGRTDEDRTVASGVCSILTVVSLLIFCGIAIAVA